MVITTDGMEVNNEPIRINPEAALCTLGFKLTLFKAEKASGATLFEVENELLESRPK